MIIRIFQMLFFAALTVVILVFALRPIEAPPLIVLFTLSAIYLVGFVAHYVGKKFGASDKNE